MKSKTERTIEAMDAIYKEVRARKRKEFWQTCKKVLSFLFEIATRLFLIYGIYYFICRAEPGDASATIGTGAIATASILLNVKDRKIDKLEKELKDRSYNIEKE